MSCPAEQRNFEGLYYLGYLCRQTKNASQCRMALFLSCWFFHKKILPANKRELPSFFYRQTNRQKLSVLPYSLRVQAGQNCLQSRLRQFQAMYPNQCGTMYYFRLFQDQNGNFSSLPYVQ